MKRYNIMSAKRYTKKDNTEGTKWVKLGSVVQSDDGKMFGDLDSIPLGNWFDGSIQLFEVEQQQQNQPQLLFLKKIDPLFWFFLTHPSRKKL